MAKKTDRQLIVGLDIGTSKVVALVGEIAADNSIEIIGIGSQPSRGLKRGVVVNIESTLFGRIDKPKAPKLKKGVPVPKALKGHRKAIFEASGKSTKTPIYDGARLGAGARVSGPAIIEEVTTTIVIEPGWTATLDASGSYVITRRKR